MEQQENSWQYCSLQQDPRTGQLFMLVHNGTSWVFGHVVKQLIDYEKDIEVVS